MVLANGSLSSQSGVKAKSAKTLSTLTCGLYRRNADTALLHNADSGIALVPCKEQEAKRQNAVHRRSELGTMVTRKLRELTDEDIKKIADTYNAFVEGTLEDEKGFCAVVTTQDIAKQDYILTPGRYVGIEEQEDDGEPFEEKMGRLTSELSELFTKSHELEAQIKERLGAIGYDI